MKFQNFFAERDTIVKMKGQARHREKMFAKSCI